MITATRMEVTRWRVLTAARVFTLATALGLAASAGEVPDVAVAFLVLCVLAAVMSIPTPGSALKAAAPIAEGALVTLVLVSLGEAATPLLVYLVVPVFVAGLQLGGRWPFLAVATEFSAATAALLVGHQTGEIGGMLERTGPWILAGLGLGLLGSWMHAHGSRPGDDQAGYESAHRLLAQLRAVSRRLSSGLDTSALAEQVLAHTMTAVGGRRAHILVRSDGGNFIPIAATGEPLSEPLEHDALLKECWRSEKPQRRRLDEAERPSGHRTVVPLRVGARIIGVVVADSPDPVNKPALSRLRSLLDEHSVRLETALLFDEVRSTATTEERIRLAREIHDGVAQEIASLGYLVDDLAASAPAPEGQQTARELRRELSRVVSELRLSIFDLRTNVNPHAGLGLALSDYAREVGRRGGLTVHLALSEQPQRLQINVETELLRIAQEAITNARKHARASNLWVRLDTESPIVSMRVEDDGVGSAGLRDDHYGLRIMQERAERIGGEVTISDRRTGGTSVNVTVWPHTNTSSGAHHDHLRLAR